MAFELVDALSAEGASRLAALKRAVLPVLARGGESVVAVDLQKIAEFVGLELERHQLLPAATLVGKWLRVLRSASRSLSQVPLEGFDTPITPGNDRTVRIVGHHILRIAESYVESAQDGTPATLEHSERKLDAGSYRTPQEFVDYANRTMARLSAWWGGGPSRSSRPGSKRTSVNRPCTSFSNARCGIARNMPGKWRPYSQEWASCQPSP